MGIAITNGCTNMLLYRQCSHCRQSMPKPTACVSSCSSFGTIPCGVSINSNLCTLLLKNSVTFQSGVVALYGYLLCL